MQLSRRAMAGAVVVVLLAAGGPGGGAAAEEFDVGGEDDEIHWSGDSPGGAGDGTSDDGGGTGGGPPPPGPGSGHGPTRYYIEQPYLVARDDGTFCTETEWRDYPSEEEAREGAAERWRALRDYEPCADAGGGDSSGPGGAAVAFWGSVRLPAPEPHIAPGWAVTGRKAFLETGGTPRQTWVRDTPHGQLVIDAEGPYHVDWGDGTATGPHHEPGGPWPEGRITHVYERTGTYDVVVTQHWIATWHMGDRSGTLSGLRTEGRIDAFEVRELQAVRNR